jgi:hypothetical protein
MSGAFHGPMCKSRPGRARSDLILGSHLGEEVGPNKFEVRTILAGAY